MYQIDTQAAKQADSAGGRITEKGKYVGKFTRAQHVVADSGTIGIDFDFVADGGQRARFSIYTKKADGTTTYGYKQLMAILACMSLRGLDAPKPIPARVYDYDTQQEVDRVLDQFPELLGRPIGLLLRMEEYEKRAGGTAWRPTLAFSFQAETELMASEILSRKTTPEQLPRVLMTLADKPLRGGSGNSFDAANRAAAAAAEFDDIPY